MIDSGTLGPKGHTQVVLPGKTETYSSTNDAEDTTEIPHCTLKMFPEETLHCIEWALDIFGNIFTNQAKNFNKLLTDEEEVRELVDPEIIKVVQQALELLREFPGDFSGCLKWARLKFN